MRRPAYSRYARSLVCSTGLLAIFLAGCSDRVPTEPATETADETIETPITVIRAVPSEGEQQETLEVRIYGTAFPDDAVPVWERDGVTDTTVAVGHVVFVSATELRATITIAADAEPGLRDISVFSNKKGIGSETRGTGEDLFLVNEHTPQPLAFLTVGLWSGTSGHASAINDRGVIAGSDYIAAAHSRLAMYWTPDGDSAPIMVAGDAGAGGINNRGWIVGWSGGDAFIFENGMVTYLPGINGPSASANAINYAGTVVGASQSKPVVWRRNPDGTYNSPTELPRLNEQATSVTGSASAINDRGDVVGTLWLKSQYVNSIDTVAVLWSARGGGSYDPPVVLGRSANSSAWGINDAGWIVGILSGSGQKMRAALWHPDDYNSPVSLSDPNSLGETYARAINNHGQIVGTLRHDGITELGTLWTVDEHGALVATTRLLPLPGYESVEAAAINDAGWIVGHSKRNYAVGFWPNPNRPMHATLWRPDR
jgi:uncharacterized membrane protein